MEAEICATRREKIKGWISLARPPFLSVGILPFTLGSVMAGLHEGYFNWALWALGTLAVVLVMVSTHFAGECFDYEEDRISGERGRSRFAGGSGVVQSGVVSRRAVLAGSVVALVAAGIVGITIWIGYGTGPWTIPLGLLGMIGGFFYSTPPVRWVSTGFGELWIGLCYGTLPATVGFYLPTGDFDILIMLVSIPIGATIFNVILGNEFPDYESDTAAGKSNMLARLGRDRGARLYAVVTCIGWAAAFVSVWAGVPPRFILYYSVPLLLSGYATLRLLQGAWRNYSQLEVVCGTGIIANLGTTLAYILAFATS